jgi:hypothetical protein
MTAKPRQWSLNDLISLSLIGKKLKIIYFLNLAKW